METVLSAQSNETSARSDAATSTENWRKGYYFVLDVDFPDFEVQPEKARFIAPLDQDIRIPNPYYGTDQEPELGVIIEQIWLWRASDGKVCKSSGWWEEGYYAHSHFELAPNWKKAFTWSKELGRWHDKPECVIVQSSTFIDMEEEAGVPEWTVRFESFGTVMPGMDCIRGEIPEEAMGCIMNVLHWQDPNSPGAR